MTEIDKKTACSFTGHRAIKADFDVEELKKAVYNAINEGFSIFLCGMALGFDSVAFCVCEEIRKEKDIKIIACVPCADQAELFNKKQQKEYSRMIESADEVITLCENYYDGCMQARNCFLVDNSSRLIAYLYHKGGGTYQTVKYAAESGIDVFYLGK